MCGIAGAFALTAETVRFEPVVQALQAMKHRGPDDEGYAAFARDGGRVDQATGFDSAPGVGFAHWMHHRSRPYSGIIGHRRLAIIDRGPTGHQPMAGAGGTLWIALNGEIYNYVELRQELAARGWAFQSKSDTEVLLAAYWAWGLSMWSRLVGMYAFAIVDLDRQQVILARDPFGIKPLYYVQNEGLLAFASEQDPVIDLGRLPRCVNAPRLGEFVYRGISDYGGETMYSRVSQIPAAHYMLVDLKTRRVGTPVRYWQPNLTRTLNVSFEEAAATLRHDFLDSVRIHLRSDVPVGSCLSGGIDSSSIACSMRALLGHSHEIQAFTAASRDDTNPDAKYAAIAAASAGLIHHETAPTSGGLATHLEEMLKVQGEPIGGSSVYAQYAVFASARAREVPVMLDGQGADELFAGYPQYIGGRLMTLAAQLRPFSAMRLMLASSRLPGLSPRSVASIFASSAATVAVARRQQLTQGLLATCVDQKWFLERGFDPALPLFKERPIGVSRMRWQLWDSVSRTSLPTLLRYEDRNSMAHSVESRLPFLTTRIAEYAFSLPETYLLTDRGLSKAVLRSALTGTVPPQILQRRDKVGFETPQTKWLLESGSWVDALLDGFDPGLVPMFKLDRVRASWRTEISSKSSQAFALWRLLSTLSWIQRGGVAS